MYGLLIIPLTFSACIVDLNVFVSTRARIPKYRALHRHNALIFVATSGLHGPQCSSGLAIDFPVRIAMAITDGDGKTAIVGSDDVQIQILAAGDV